jgi:hypothetical protein
MSPNCTSFFKNQNGTHRASGHFAATRKFSHRADDKDPEGSKRIQEYRLI